MNYQYTPFDPLVWLIFAVFIVFIYVVVRLYHWRYPDYPEKVETEVNGANQIDPGIEKNASTPGRRTL